MSVRKVLPLALALGAALAPVGPARAAQLFVETTVIEGAFQDQDVAIQTVGPFQGSFSNPQDAAYDGAWWLQYGVGCAAARVDWGGAGTGETGRTRTNVAWDDQFTVTAPGKTNGVDQGWLAVALEIDGELAVDASASRAGYRVDFFLGDSEFLLLDWFGECTTGPNVCSGGNVIGDPFGTYPSNQTDPTPLLLHFTFGEPIFMDIRLDTFAEGMTDESRAGDPVDAPPTFVSLRWLAPIVLDDSMVAVASATLTSESGADYARDAASCGSGEAAHDLAISKLKAPKKLTLSEKKPLVKKDLKLTIVNQGSDTETIDDLAELGDLITLRWTSLPGPGPLCPAPTAVLEPPKKGFPVVLPTKKKLSVSYDVSWDCANDPAQSSKTEDHTDFEVEVTVDHSVLGGGLDSDPSDDVCPRAPGGDDKGCGSKGGGDILIDVVRR